VTSSHSESSAGNWLPRNNFSIVQYRSECIYILQINFIKKKLFHELSILIFNSHTVDLPCCKWVPVTTSWRVLGLRKEERPPIWRVAANILNKQSRTAEKGWSSSLGLGEGLTTPRCKNESLLRNITYKASDLD
jgi:hypothetical protein